MTTATHAATSSAPYQEGVELRIQRHVPPTPFGSGYRFCPRPDSGLDWAAVRYGVDRVAFALDNPPLETEPPDQEKHTFTITGSKTVRRFDPDSDDSGNGGAHVVTGYFDRDEEVVCLAKIFDGVYYPLLVEGGCDCMMLADAEYAKEAWAYGTIQPVEGVGRKLVPEYYGAWTFPVATDRPGHPRWVRMLLFQLVPGETVLDKICKATKNGVVQRSLLPDEQTRLRVIKHTMEADLSIFWNAEVRHGDLTPRNAMVQPDGSVVLIDFNQAEVYPFYYQPHPKYDEVPSLRFFSPIEKYWPLDPWGSGTFDVATPGNPWESWAPEAWKNPDVTAEWLLETWGSPAPGSLESAPLSDYFLNHRAHAKRNKKIQAALERLGRKPAEA
ncbi:hypothetical protein N658DRAFT_430121 [Parathielavia hyrcaniae]|uniref:Protein kinase domain-containing protein n=1 Tax=Parathielavia hyrcaniae TaxID=113614 RepID=A0AAN6Q1N0_9PEZI|nr:hypothetical protein N658DRAFT_430121 [Parathielavia hyrcaniae]